jgi:hypothetical protein
MMCARMRCQACFHERAAPAADTHLLDIADQSCLQRAVLFAEEVDHIALLALEPSEDRGSAEPRDRRT